MGQRSNCVAAKNARINPEKGEFAEGMVQRLNGVAVKDAQIKSSMEECA